MNIFLLDSSYAMHMQICKQYAYNINDKKNFCFRNNECIYLFNNLLRIIKNN